MRFLPIFRRFWRVLIAKMIIYTSTLLDALKTRIFALFEAFNILIYKVQFLNITNIGTHAITKFLTIPNFLRTFLG